LHNGISEFPMERFFATCPRGLELLLAEELQVLNAEKVHAVGGGVHFGGDFFLCYRANLESRIARRRKVRFVPINRALVGHLFNLLV
jgi:putative N6-adenine-specific DNA methylase